ncbi:MAG: signal peptidase I [bacterium]|nr:signal peptidase I [bacterium]
MIAEKNIININNKEEKSSSVLPLARDGSLDENASKSKPSYASSDAFSTIPSLSKSEIDASSKQKVQNSKNQSKQYKFIKGVLEWLIYLAIFFAIVYGTPTVLSKILRTEYPIASITSSSMWPALKQGDVVFIQGASGKDDIQVGNVVVFINDISGPDGQASFTIHRVIKINDRTFQTKGDANNIDDAPTPYEKLIGKTVEFRGQTLRIPYLGKLSQFSSNINQ